MKAIRISLYGFLTWSVLLALSTGYRFWQGVSPAAPPELTIETLSIDAAWVEGNEVQLAYRTYGSSNDQIPILLLHGNPMASQAVQPLAQALPDDHYILSPDLNGLGYSSRNLDAYSAINQASILLAWLDTHDIKQVHAVAYSQGGAVALELADRTPERIKSVSLIASVGLQEHELLGSYELNQPIYSIYYAFAWSLRWLTPHFGLFDHPTFSTTTVDNFADTDLRLNRDRLEQLQLPTLILHSTQHKLVPYAAAKAHAELVPQAYFENLPGGHMGIFNHTQEYAYHIGKFLANVENGEAYSRASKLAENRPHQPGKHFDPPANTRFLQVLLLSALLFLLVFASEDLSCIAGGILAASGAMPLSAAIAGCFLGIWVSDVLIYLIGHTFGAGALKSRFFKRIKEDDYRCYQMAYGKRGLKIVFLTRFIPGSRVIAYLTAGILRLGAVRFAIWLFLAAGVWTPILVTAAYLIGHPLIDWWEAYGLKLLPVIALCIVALYFSIGLICKSFTYRGRAELRGRWIRLTQWEYWPALPVYLPVFLYGCWLALRYRSTTLWALCNPGMHPISGLAMESKSEILKSLNPASNKLPEWTLLPESANTMERLHAFQQFQKKRGELWPVVFKPDVGQRGEGVAVIDNLSQAERYLSANSEAIIVQAYASGPEFGVFYYRLPGE
ncbi:MAG: alpha/beta fold hydrolase, partial [Coraliomargarita sp.]